MATKLIAAAEDWLEIEVSAQAEADRMAAVMIEISHGATPFAGAVTLQIRQTDDLASEWRDVPDGVYSVPAVDILRLKLGGWRVRAGFKAGAYTSGVARVVLL